MASLHRELSITAPPAAVWEAVADFGAVHRRLAPGFVTDATLDGDARIVTFGNGTTAREILVDCDHDRKRLVYAITSDRVQHYNASVQVIADGVDRCRVLWTVDLLPHAIAAYIGVDRCRVLWTVDLLPHAIAAYIAAQMDQAVTVMQATLDAITTSPA